MTLELTPIVDGETLITLEEAIAYIVAGGSTAPDSDDVNTQLLGVSDAIRDHCRRRFTHPAVTEDRNVPVFDNLTVYCEELLSVTSVKDSAGVALEYTVMPGERSGEHVLWVELAEAQSGYIVVNGTWGWVAIPERVKQACRVATRLWFLRDLSTMTTVLDTQTGFIERPATLPKIVLGLLAKLVWECPV